MIMLLLFSFSLLRVYSGSIYILYNMRYCNRLNAEVAVRIQLPIESLLENEYVDVTQVLYYCFKNSYFY